jgi:fatty acid desaturase
VTKKYQHQPMVSSIQVTPLNQVTETEPLSGGSYGSNKAAPPNHIITNEYIELKRLIKQKGLLDKQPVYALLKMLLALGLLAVGLVLLVVIANPWLQLLNAAYLAFVFTQLGFIGHDVGHRQAFHAAWKNSVFGHIFGNLLLGVSHGWWVDKHNQHHSHPNQSDADPDIDIPALAFTEEQAHEKRGLLRTIVKYQVYFFFPILTLVSLGLRIESIRYILSRKARYPLLEIFLIVAHFGLYLGLLLYFLGVWWTLLFIIIHQALFGLYMGSVFAPNHKGMLILDKDVKMDFLRQQVLTARNVKANPLIDFWYGGLNYQIEHHLFPGMSQNKLRDAQRIVRTFCQTHAISYHETGMVESYQEILQSLHEVSAPLRKAKSAA